MRAGDVEIEDEGKIQFNKHRSPPNIKRGVCRACQNPVVGFMMLVPGIRIAFIPTQMYTDPEDIFAATIHIFYDKRVDDIEDALPKYSGYLSSELAVTRLLTPKLLGR